ncbi:MAG: BMP family ABC transporter substrate-binding protein [Anaerolineaceae bacterium]
MKTKYLSILIGVLLTVSFLVGCAAPTAAPVQPAENTESKPLRVLLIGNSRFGDLGPMDDYARGLDQCAQKYGYEIKKLESVQPERNEEDVRAMVKEGYDLIITTFPGMSEATKVVAIDNPNQKFFAIYQFINAGEEKIPNIWSSEFRGFEAGYMMGAFAAKMTESKKIGFVAGQPSESINSDINGFMQGVQATCPECSVEVGFANNWEDPALGKEIASAMISRGVDFIQTEASKTQLGVIEAAKEAGILISGDNGDNYDLYKEGFVSWLGWSFSRSVEVACDYLNEGTLPLGQHTYMNLQNGGVYVNWDDVTRFVNDNPKYADRVNTAMKFAQDIEAKIGSGEIKPIYNIDTPKGLEPGS